MIKIFPNSQGDETTSNTINIKRVKNVLVGKNYLLPYSNNEKY